MESDLQTLSDLWRSWRTAGTSMAPQDWSRPTRCSSWDIKTLYAHHSRAVTRLNEFCNSPSAHPPDHPSAASFLGQFPRRQDDPELVDDVATALASHTSTDQLVSVFAIQGPDAIHNARQLGNLVVQTDEGRIFLREYLRTRIVESVVHLLDLADALNTTPYVPSDALRTTAHVLVEFTPLDEFIDMSTGRSHKDLFPVFW